MKTLILFLLSFYKNCVSPYLPPSCRFVPSCSQYASHAVMKHGAWRGGVMGVRRVMRCHPFHPGGYDPVQ